MILMFVLSFIITTLNSGETIQCYNCTNCSTPINSVTCQEGFRKCITAKGYLTNGTFQMARSCTDMTDNLYDWTFPGKRTFDGVDYVNVSAMTCTSDNCNSDLVDVPSAGLYCYDCTDCRTRTSNSVHCQGVCFIASGLLPGGNYVAFRGCANSENSNYHEDTYFFQREFNIKMYSYIWMRTCRTSLCNGDSINYTNPFEADSYFDVIDDVIESSARQIQLDGILFISIVHVVLFNMFV